MQEQVILSGTPFWGSIADRKPPIAVRQATEDRPIAHPKRLIGDRKAAEKGARSRREARECRRAKSSNLRTKILKIRTHNRGDSFVGSPKFRSEECSQCSLLILYNVLLDGIFPVAGREKPKEKQGPPRRDAL